MDKITEFFRVIFKDRIKDIEGERVRVIPKHLPESKIPCITIHNNGGNIVAGSEKLININAPLSPSNPLYDESNPDILYAQQFRRSKNRTTVQVNVWAVTEQDRYHINEQVKTLIWLLKSDHHTLCPNLNKGFCENIKTDCPAITKNNYHSAKGQCPKPREYQYHSLFTEYDILRKTFKNNPEFNQDELDKKQPLLRTIHNYELEYYEYWNLHGNISLNNNFTENIT